MTAFAERIRQAREKQRKTKKEIAELVGCTPVFIGHIESGERLPSDELSKRLAHYLKIPIKELFPLLETARREKSLHALKRVAERFPDIEIRDSLEAIPEITNYMNRARNPEEYAKERAKWLNEAANIARTKGDYTFAHTLVDEAMRIYEKLEDPKGIATSHGIKGLTLYEEGKCVEARVHLEESVRLHREVSDKDDKAYALKNLGRLLRNCGNSAQARGELKDGWELLEQAREKFEESKKLYKSLENTLAGAKDKATARNGKASAIYNLGTVETDESNFNEARRCYQDSLKIFWDEEKNRGAMAWVFEGIATLAAKEKQWTHAAQFFGAAEVLHEVLLYFPVPPVERALYNRVIGEIREELDDNALLTAWWEGRRMVMESFEQCIYEARKYLGAI